MLSLNTSDINAKRCGGGMELEFYAPPHCTKKCTLKKSSFESKGIIENVVFVWSDRQLFSIDMTIQELLMGQLYLRMRNTKTKLPYPAFTKVTTVQIQLALRVASSCAKILSDAKHSQQPLNNDIKCSERWFMWTTCLNTVLNRMKRNNWSFVCVGFV